MTESIPAVTTATPPGPAAMETADIVVVVVYLLLVIAVGIWVGPLTHTRMRPITPRGRTW